MRPSECRLFAKGKLYGAKTPPVAHKPALDKTTENCD